jgi:acetyl esterase
VARLFRIAACRIPSGRRRFGEILQHTSTARVPTRHGEVQCTVYRPPSNTEGRDSRPPVYVNAHGGGFVIGNPAQDAPLCRYLAHHGNVFVVNVDYGLAPRHRFPEPVEQLYDVLCWASSDNREWDGSRLCVGGQSAGGSLAAAASRLALENGCPQVALQVLHYAVLDLVTPLSEKRLPGPGSPLKPWMGEVFHTSYVPDPEMRSDRLASPAWGHNADGITGIAPALVISAEHDSLRDEAEAYAESLDAVGSLVNYHCVENAHHGYDLVGSPPQVVRPVYDLMVNHVIRATGGPID